VLPAPFPQYSRDNEAETRRQIDAALREIRASQQPLVLQASATWNPTSLADGAVDATTVPVLGAAVGDPALAGFPAGANRVLLSAHVSAADTVHVTLMNKTGGVLDLASDTLTVLVWKRRS
jgi:hypothetical protein